MSLYFVCVLSDYLSMPCSLFDHLVCHCIFRNHLSISTCVFCDHLSMSLYFVRSFQDIDVFCVIICCFSVLTQVCILVTHLNVIYVSMFCSMYKTMDLSTYTHTL